ncbi:hypothetical protein HaLaN_08603 [Haematococcus lacustris]|uniref:Uncharacterized protein n=1 Tax=Haematococcus lacustris TaxID=44745 RepID=A0A699YTB2_HAELA|nr:hypothetical protein HaLaN_08603 [Haematococcus lacustris]
MVALPTALLSYLGCLAVGILATFIGWQQTAQAREQPASDLCDAHPYQVRQCKPVAVLYMTCISITLTLCLCSSGLRYHLYVVDIWVSTSARHQRYRR